VQGNSHEIADCMDRLMSRLRAYYAKALEVYRALSLQQKISLWILWAVNVALTVVFLLVGPQKIFEAMAAWADQLRGQSVWV
jgi:hypothetical protein